MTAFDDVASFFMALFAILVILPIALAAGVVKFVGNTLVRAGNGVIDVLDIITRNLAIRYGL